MQWWYGYIKKDLKGLLNCIYHYSHGRDVNWDLPTEWNEKIIWQQIYGDTSAWTKLADKYQVRSYLEERGFGKLLIPLYGIYNDANEIDFNQIPAPFVIKTNNGCGDVIIVNKKEDADWVSIRKRMNKYLGRKYGRLSGEPHYFKIIPKIIIEKKIVNDKDFSNSPVDYKFYCFHGNPVVCGVYFNRDPQTHLTMTSFYDMDWNLHEEWLNPSKPKHNIKIPQPQNFQYMKELCVKLCKDFAFCRLDLYESEDRVYFGEFTFTPAGYSGGSLNPTMYDYFGTLMNI